MIISNEAPRYYRLQVADLNDAMYNIRVEATNVLGTITNFDTDASPAIEPMLREVLKLARAYTESGENPFVAFSKCRDAVELSRAVAVMGRPSCVLTGRMGSLAGTCERTYKKAKEAHFAWISGEL